MVSGTASVITVLGFPLLLMTTLIGMHHFERWSGRRPSAPRPHPFRRPTPTTHLTPYPDDAPPEITLADHP